MFLKKIYSAQVLIILLFISIVILILAFPRSKKITKPIIHVSTIDTTQSVDFSLYYQKDKNIQAAVQQYQKKEITIDSLILYLNKKQLPQLSAYFEEIKNIHSPIDTIWFHIGKNYYDALGFASDLSETEPILASAARCFNRAISFNEKNTNAKIMLASCYMQTNNPMLGIQMLKEIEKTDSSNVLLQMQLAEFSLRSNQLDKAIQRYKKALALDTNRIEIYAYLSEIYIQKKDTFESIQFLRKFAAKISDTVLKNSIHQYIYQLNKNKPIH